MSADAPERALEQARERAAAARKGGEYADAERFLELDGAPDDGLLKLHKWAFLEIEPSQIYSTRRLGAPITLIKRALLRLLSQFHGELMAQQTRFNLHLVGEVARLQERVARLERLVATEDDRR